MNNSLFQAPMRMVRVPATSANLGAGFDTAGLALDIYNAIAFCEAETLTIELSEPNPAIPLNESNLIYLAAKQTADRNADPRPGHSAYYSAGSAAARFPGSQA